MEKVDNSIYDELILGQNVRANWKRTHKNVMYVIQLIFLFFPFFFFEAKETKTKWKEKKLLLFDVKEKEKTNRFDLH